MAKAFGAYTQVLGTTASVALLPGLRTCVRVLFTIKLKTSGQTEHASL